MRISYSITRALEITAPMIRSDDPTVSEGVGKWKRRNGDPRELCKKRSNSELFMGALYHHHRFLEPPPTNLVLSSSSVSGRVGA